MCDIRRPSSSSTCAPWLPVMRGGALGRLAPHRSASPRVRPAGAALPPHRTSSSTAGARQGHHELHRSCRTGAPGDPTPARVAPAPSPRRRAPGGQRDLRRSTRRRSRGRRGARARLHLHLPRDGVRGAGAGGGRGAGRGSSWGAMARGEGENGEGERGAQVDKV
jgi:hypothetical protein